ncbi:HTH-type transcriptional repressor YvoA [Microbacterium oxydans]|uniref:HTH-type transcriptional repressor YvoA n=1 Tax=Microbacterium oxydans TaxID=82380 RepID=A0A0F0KNU9_9MICO|nr:GntR family transcriptional regulator [Microbacterium oxydans]KJL22134.1 HTH-type transcriptional repressor YvoA [Microbacterium oxydans]
MTSSISESPIRADYPEPLWIQAVNLIKVEISSGRLAEGMRLPPERELCTQLGISRVTLRKALLQLVEEGVLSSSHGRGWYVASAPVAKEWPNSLESFSETARRMGLEATSIVLRAETGHASLDEAEAIGVAPGTPIFRLDRIRLLDGVPIALDASVVPAALLPDVSKTDFAVDSLYELLDAAGSGPERADSTIEAREADAQAAESLNVAVGSPLLVMRQAAHGSDGRVVSLSTIRYVGERYRLRTVFTRGSGPTR